MLNASRTPSANPPLTAVWRNAEPANLAGLSASPESTPKQPSTWQNAHPKSTALQWNSKSPKLFFNLPLWCWPTLSNASKKNALRNMLNASRTPSANPPLTAVWRNAEPANLAGLSASPESTPKQPSTWQNAHPKSTALQWKVLSSTPLNNVYKNLATLNFLNALEMTNADISWGNAEFLTKCGTSNSTALLKNRPWVLNSKTSSTAVDRTNASDCGRTSLWLNIDKRNWIYVFK